MISGKKEKEETKTCTTLRKFVVIFPSRPPIQENIPRNLRKNEKSKIISKKQMLKHGVQIGRGGSPDRGGGSRSGGGVQIGWGGTGEGVVVEYIFCIGGMWGKNFLKFSNFLEGGGVPDRGGLS